MKAKSTRYRAIGLLVILTMLLTSVLAGCGKTTEAVTKSDAPKANKGTVKIGMVTWTEDIVITNVAKQMLEKEGYTVEVTSLEVAPLFVGLSKGDLDIYLDGWLPTTQKNYWDQYGDKLDKIPGSWYTGNAKVGIVVPKYVTINSIEEMGKEKDKFSGELIGIDPGANATKTINKMIAEYGFGIKQVNGSEAAMMAAMDKAYRANKWVAIFGWSPHWMWAKYDLKYLEDPKKYFGESEEIVMLANKDFNKKMPAVVEMLKKIKMDDKQVGTIESMMNDGMQAPEAAKKWMDENKSVVDGWMK